jgi:3-oxoacyl-[acyl-carrier-protein] synthase-3
MSGSVGGLTARFNHVHLEAFGYALPPHVVTSADLERELRPVYDRFGLHEGRLELMTGIRERRFWDEGAPPSDGSTLAGRRALEISATRADQVECLIHASVSRDFLEPATASVVHHRLGLPDRAMFYDVSNACLGFLNGILNIANMIELGQIRRGLVVAGESSRALVRSTIRSLRDAPDLTRRQLKVAFASLTIGSAAVALLMTHSSVAQSGCRLIGSAARAATEHNHLCRGSADTGFAGEADMVMDTDAETLLEEGCALAARTWSDFQEVTSWTAADIDRAFTHQVGQAHRDRFYSAIDIDAAKDFSTFPFLGNTGSAALPVTAAIGIEQAPPSPGTRAALLGIGSGLHSVMLGVQWTS